MSTPSHQFVVLADIVQSRDLVPAHRRAVQQRIQALVGGALAFRFSGGDEFEWVLPDHDDSWDRLLLLRAVLAVGDAETPGIKLRCGVGRGPITVDSDDGPYAQDGPAFHHARAAYDSLRASRTRRHSSHLAPFEPAGRLPQSIALHDGSPAPERAALVSLMDAIMQGWSASQWAAIVCRLQGLRYEDAGARLGVSAQAVQQRLRAARLDLYLVGHAALKASMGQGGWG